MPDGLGVLVCGRFPPPFAARGRLPRTRPIARRCLAYGRKPFGIVPPQVSMICYETALDWFCKCLMPKETVCSKLTYGFVTRGTGKMRSRIDLVCETQANQRENRTTFPAYSQQLLYECQLLICHIDVATRVHDPPPDRLPRRPGLTCGEAVLRRANLVQLYGYSSIRMSGGILER